MKEGKDAILGQAADRDCFKQQGRRVIGFGQQSGGNRVDYGIRSFTPESSTNVSLGHAS